MQVPHIVVTALPNLQLDSKRPRCHMAVGVRHGASPKPLLELALLPASPLLCDHLKHHNTILQAAPPDFTYCPLILALLLIWLLKHLWTLALSLPILVVLIYGLLLHNISHKSMVFIFSRLVLHVLFDPSFYSDLEKIF